MIQSGDPLSIETPFVGYSYSYPHKSAYRQLSPAVPLDRLWADEQRDALFLYFHIPFCEYRCGFCNLFTLAGGDEPMVSGYLRQLKVEAKQVRSALPDARFARIAIGGGTPTYLNEEELETFLEIAVEIMGAHPQRVPVSCEASPATLTPAKAKLLRQWGVDRLSLGVQSFDDSEAKALGRPQHAGEVHRAIEMVRDQGFPILNLDLIYGVPSQSLESWLWSVDQAASFRPEEIYLYPLYVRELTGLGKISAQPNDGRLEAYRAARDRLLEAGYQQRSLRMFQLPDSDDNQAPVYCCQSDGMVGLGCGARSYTHGLHYSNEFAVGRTSVRSILADYVGRPAEAFLTASHGFRLDQAEQRRRYVIQSLLQVEGISQADYRQRFDADLLHDLPQLGELLSSELAVNREDRIQLTPQGVELSDAIGPWLYSPQVQQLMEAFECH